MASIDELQIELNANASRANDAIDRLSGKIGNLSKSLSGLNTSNLTGLANGVNKLSVSMQSMKSVGTADFTRLAKNLNSLGSVNTSNINKLASSLNQLSSTFNRMGNVSTQAKSVSDIANALRQFGLASTTKAIANIPQLATALKGLMQTLSTAPRVSNNLIQMTNALAKLARTGGASGTAANSLARNFKALNTTTGKSRKGFGGLASTIGKVYATYFMLFRAVGKLKDAIDISSSLTELENVVNHTFGASRTILDNFTKDSIDKFGMSKLAAEQYASRFQAMGVAMGISNNSVAQSTDFLNKKLGNNAKIYGNLGNSMADMSVNLTKLTSDYASFFDIAQSDVAEDFQSIFTSQTKPLRQYGLDLTQASLKEFALANGLNADIQAMSRAEKAMLSYQYVMANSGHIMGDFARTADTWHNVITRIKNNFQNLGATVGDTLIHLLKPVMIWFNNAIVIVNKFAESVSNALGKLLGWKYEMSEGGVTTNYEDAAESVDDMAAGTGKAAKAAKELKKQLQGVDELNVLSSDSGNDGGAGSGAGAGNIGALGETGKEGSWVQADKFYDSDVNTWKDLGEKIKNSVKGALDGINWSSVYLSAYKFGTGLAEFLNGLFSGVKGETLFASIGGTIANSLNSAFAFLNNFGRTFDWKQFGFSVADGINKFFSTFGFASAGKTIGEWIKGVLTSALEFLKQTDFEKIGKKIGEFIKNLDINGIANKLTEVLWEAIKSAFNLLKGLFTEAPLETSLLAAFGILKFSGLGGSIATKIAESISKKVAASAFATKLSGVATTVGTTLTTAFTTDLPLLFGAGTFAEVATAVVGGLLGALVAAFAGFKLGEWLSENNVFHIGDIAEHIVDDMGLGDVAVGVIDAFEDMASDGVGGFFKKCWENLKTSAGWLADKFKVVPNAIATKVKEFIEIGKNVVKFLKDGITSAIKSIATWIKENVVDKIVSGFNTLTTGISAVFSLAWEGVKTVWGVISDWFNTYVFTPVSIVFTAIKSAIESAFSDAWTLIVSVWTKVNDWFNNTIAKPVVQTFNGVANSISSSFENAWGKVKNVWNTVSNWFKTYILSPITSTFTTIKTNVSKAFEDAWTSVKNVWNTVKGWFDSNIKTPLTTSFNTVKTNIGNAFKNAWSTAKGVWDKVSGWFTNSIKVPIEKTFNNLKTNIGNALSDAWKTVKAVWDVATSWFTSLVGNVKDVFTGKKGIKEAISDAFKDAYAAMKRIWDVVGTYFKGIANDVIQPIGKAINGVIKGINWVLSKVGSSKKLSEWTVPKFAKGTGGLPIDTLGMVNDQKGSTYREMIIPKNGKPFIPEGRNVILPMQKGTKIMPANQTKAFMRGVPHFEGGIGDVFSGIATAVKSFTGDMVDYLAEPGEAVKIAIGKFVKTDGMGDTIGAIAKGAVNTVFDSAVAFVKKVFDGSTAAKVEKAIKWAVNIANDNRHGYDQGSRWGNPDYDCSSLVISAFEQAGIKLKTGGATYTGNILSVALANGFKNVKGSVNLTTAGGMKRGDILLNEKHHTALYLGKGQIVQASSNERGGAAGGQPGDQTGNEIGVRGYYNYPWDAILRFGGKKYAKGFGKITPMDFGGYYAAGGFPDKGTMFVAGEAGVEAVAHINGQSEVLNKSQIAKAMYDAVASANAQQNALLQQQNDYLYQLLQKETGISYKDVFEATRKGASEYQIMNGRPAFI